jgi:hypothetical protein
MWNRNNEHLDAPDPDPQPQLEAGTVYLDDSFNTLRFDGWEPTDLMATVHPMLDKARAEGQHIWDSTEQYQAYALGCWTAAARRTMGEALLVGVEESVHYKGSYPVEVAELSKSFFLDAEKWRAFATDVATKPDYRVDGVSLTPEAAWPLPPTSHVSPRLMDGLQHILGLGGEESKLLTDLLPHVATEADGPHYKRFFDDYKGTVGREEEALKSRLEFISQRWREGLDPNSEPGRTLYMDMVRCAEAYVALGAHKLMPATLNPRLRVAVREVAAKPVEPDLPAFSITGLLGNPAAPELKAFDASGLVGSPAQPAAEVAPGLKPFNAADLLGSQTSQAPAEDVTAESTSQLPAFDATQIIGTKALTETQEDAAQLPTFDPSQLFGASAVTGAGIVVEVEPEHVEEQPKTLPVFDPDQFKS